jgi:hypothetical protein
MSRPNTFRVIVFSVLAVVALMATACGNADEQVLFNKYFMSSKIADNLTLTNIATVSFDPAKDGQMVSFSIKEVGPDKVTPLSLKAGADELRAVQATEKEFSAKKQAFQDENTVAIERIVKAEQKNTKLTGKDLELQKTWSKWREDAKAMAQKMTDIRKKANEGRQVVELSCVDQRNPIDVSAYDGTLITRDVTITGKVKPPTGETVEKTYIFTISQATLKNVNGKDFVGRWIITGKQEAGK